MDEASGVAEQLVMRGVREVAHMNDQQAMGLSAAILRGWHPDDRFEVLTDSEGADEIMETVMEVMEEFTPLAFQELGRSICMAASHYLEAECQEALDQAAFDFDQCNACA